MLVKLTTLAEVPRPDSIVKTSSPELRPVGRDVDARGTICVALELSDKALVVEVPDGDIPVRATAKTYLSKQRGLNLGGKNKYLIAFLMNCAALGN